MTDFKREDGFSLVELLVVIVILGVLTGMGLPIFTGVRNRSYVAAVNSDLRNAATVMVGFRTSEGRYPLVGEVVLTGTAGASVTIAAPSDPGDAQDFCLEGSHAALSGAVVATYDTRAGGLTRDPGC